MASNNLSNLQKHQRLTNEAASFSRAHLPHQSGVYSQIWVFLVVAYIILSPLSIMLPPIKVFIEMNLYRLTVIGLGVLTIIQVILFNKKSGSLRRKFKVLAIITLCVYCFSVLSRYDNDLLLQFTNSFCFASYLIILLLFLSARKVPPLRFWAFTIVIASCIATLLAIGIIMEIVPVPSYRFEVEHLFRDSRSASIIDSSIGLWGGISGAYLVSIGGKFKTKALGYTGMLFGITLILLSGFRTLLLISIIVFMGAFIYVRKKKRLPIIFASLIAAILLLVVAGEFVAKFPGVERMNELLRGREQGSVSLLYRLEELKIEMNLISEKPLIGHGWNVARDYSTKLPYVGEMPLYGHNLYSAIPVRVGVPGFIIIIAAPFIALGSGITKIKNAFAPKARYNLIMCMQGVLAFLLASVTINMFLMSSSVGIVGIFVAYILKDQNCAMHYAGIKSTAYISR